MLAECAGGLNDDTAFETYLNSVKDRAGLTAYQFNGDWDAAHKELRNERARELFGEFQRKFDLVRWGIWYESVLSYTDLPELINNIKPCHRYLPIHDTQIAYSHNKLDNDEYNISEVEIKSGFNDITNFNKIFKKYIKLTPREYKNSNK